jgi:hypothetical protein
VAENKRKVKTSLLGLPDFFPLEYDIFVFIREVCIRIGINGEFDFFACIFLADTLERMRPYLDRITAD